MKLSLSRLSGCTFLLSILLIAVVFLPVNYLEFINFDDSDVVLRIHRNFGEIPWQKLFLRSYTSQYYRPLLEVLCYIDYALWGVSVQAWHLTNYILHILNACLVYFIALHWFVPGEGDEQKVWASLVVLFFALNPMTCESVAWISGRSDLSGTFFALLAVWGYYLRYGVRFFITPLAILGGLLCKENALAVLPLIILLEAIHTYQHEKSLVSIVKNCAIWSAVVVIPLFIYVTLRTNGFENYFYAFTKTTTTKAVVSTIAVAAQEPAPHDSIVEKLLFLIPVTAFYFKKLVFPFPLNFAITKISTFWYSITFMVISLINLGFIVAKKWKFPVFSLLLIVSFSPSLMVAYDKVAWTPMAERYLYLSLPVMGIGVALCLKSLMESNFFSKQIIMSAGLIIILVFATSTFHRVFIFKDSKSIWAATLRVNPESSMVLCLYAHTVKGQEAKRAYQKAVSNPEPFKWRGKALIALAQYEMSEGNYQKSLELIDKGLAIKGNYENFHHAASILAESTDFDQKITEDLRKKALQYYKKAYSKKQTAIGLYKIAVISKSLGKNKDARQLFEQVVKKYPHSEYAGFSKKHLNR